MSEVLIKGGTVLTSGGAASADVLIGGGLVVEVGPDLNAEAATEVDAHDCWVGPGLVDTHSHLREPGEEHKEDIASGSRAAAAGGYTALVAMPNTQPAVDSGHVARFVVDRGQVAGLVQVAAAGCLSLGRAGQKLAHLDELWDAGVRIFTDDGDTVADAGLLRRAMEYIAELGGVVAQHAIDPGLAAGGHMHEGAVSARLGVQGIPALAEEVVLARDLALVRLTGVRYHAQHLSTAGSVELIAAAKAEGLPVTAEVTPHHLAFDEMVVARDVADPTYKMMPPLRSAIDVTAVRVALEAGIIDVVATDHAPHAPHEKDVAFEEAPFGVTGLEWAAAVVNTTVGLDVADFFDRMSTRPAEIAGLSATQGGPVGPGRIANLVVFDPAAESTPETTYSRSVNSPYLGRPWRGAVRSTIHDGVITHSGVGAGV
jgi:dihydroorotase